MSIRFVLPCALLLCVLVGATVSTQAPRFYRDDPIAREPDSRDASGVKPWDIGLMYELSYNLFVTADYKPSNTRARNINTIDEVPDSSWFTNRIGVDGAVGRSARARARDRPAARAGEVGDHSREDRRREPGLHGEGCQRRDVVPRVRSARATRKAPRRRS